MATIKDVAKLAGVSLSTTSYALNGSSKISEPTKQKVLAAAKELNFSPNAAARSLKTKKTKIIGVVLSEFIGVHFSDLLAGINHQMTKNGYDVIVISGIETGERFIRQRLVDGMILIDSKISDDIIIKYSSSEFPFILLDRKLEREGAYSIMINNQEAFTEIINMHLNNGRRRIAYFSGEVTSIDNKYRYESYKNVLEAHNINYTRVFEGNYIKETAYQLMSASIENGDIDFDAVACANDLMAIGVVEALNDANIKVPEQVAVSGFDDIELGTYCSPKLTTYRIDRRAWGEKVGEIMLRALIQEEGIHTHEFPGYLVKRESTN